MVWLSCAILPANLIPRSLRPLPPPTLAARRRPSRVFVLVAVIAVASGSNSRSGGPSRRCNSTGQPEQIQALSVYCT